MNLLLLEEQDFIARDEIEIVARDTRYQHIKKILRLAPPDTLKAGVWQKHLGTLQLTAFDHHSLRGIYQPHHDITPSPSPIDLILGATRPIVMKRLLKDIATLGIRSLTIFASENGEKSYLASSLWHDEAYLIPIKEGLSQGVLVHPPQINLARSLHHALKIRNELFSPTSYAFILDPYSQEHRQIPSKIDMTEQSITLLIGAERGFTPQEINMAKEHFFRPLAISPRILRTETAVTASIILAQQACF